ncbi:hypothetical protein [Rhizobium leguminosarum]|nr:hypothetical protein [Rhizobium leguminosarum]
MEKNNYLPLHDLDEDGDVDGNACLTQSPVIDWTDRPNLFK